MALIKVEFVVPGLTEEELRARLEEEFARAWQEDTCWSIKLMGEHGNTLAIVSDEGMFNMPR